MTSDPTAISLIGIRKSYGDLIAVRELNLDVQKGEFFSHHRPVWLWKDHNAAHDRRI